MKALNHRGFTLMEMLIVVAIIAVLIAIAIPVFGAQLEKAREATDAANIRGAYAEVLVHGVDKPTESYSKEGAIRQTKSGWQDVSMQNGLEALNDGSYCVVEASSPAAGKFWHVSYGTTVSVWIDGTAPSPSSEPIHLSDG